MIGIHVHRNYEINSPPGVTSNVEKVVNNKEDYTDSKDNHNLHKYMAAAKQNAADYGFKTNTFQIFVSNPKKLKMIVNDVESAHIKKFTKNNRVIAHSSFAAYPWKGNFYPAKFIRMELQQCMKAGVTGLVVHLGKPGIEEVMKYISMLKLRGKKKPPLIYLETPALKPDNSHYVAPADLGALYKRIQKIDPGLNYFGLCVDTAHLWSSGIDIQSYEDSANWLESLMEHIPIFKKHPGKLLIHLNDSLVGLSSGVDQHAPLGKGEIWKKYEDHFKESGFCAFIDFALERNISIILERRNKELLAEDYLTLSALGY
jgi:endonuclease IV